MSSVRRALPGALLLILAIATLPGCWDRGKGPPLPDMSQSASELEQTAAQLARIDELMTSQLDELDELRRAFFAPADGLYDPPFPMDVYKHAAVSCLNAPIVDPAARIPGLAAAADAIGVDCAVAPLPTLLEALEPHAARRDATFARLQVIDRLRTLRAELDDRLRRLPRIIRRNRNDIATRRAELRQLEADLERRRAEYDPERFDQALERYAQIRTRVEALAEAIDAIDTARPSWSAHLAEAVDRTYRELALL